jgi:hypothetical protein
MRKNIGPSLGTRFFSVIDLNLTGRLESTVRPGRRFLPSFEANVPQICIKLFAIVATAAFRGGSVTQRLQQSSRQQTIHHPKN